MTSSPSVTFRFEGTFSYDNTRGAAVRNEMFRGIGSARE